MRRDTLHLTLAFLGDVDAARIPDLRGIAYALKCAPFALTLDRLGSWHGHRVLWLGPATPPGALAGLSADLAERLEGADFALAARAFSPHVTLVRNAAHAPSARETEPLVWRVGSFVLVASERTADGARYRRLGRWSLRPGGDGGR